MRESAYLGQHAEQSGRGTPERMLEVSESTLQTQAVKIARRIANTPVSERAGLTEELKRVQRSLKVVTRAQKRRGTR